MCGLLLRLPGKQLGEPSPEPEVLDALSLWHVVVDVGDPGVGDGLIRLLHTKLESPRSLRLRDFIPGPNASEDLDGGVEGELDLARRSKTLAVVAVRHWTVNEAKVGQARRKEEKLKSSTVATGRSTSFNAGYQLVHLWVQDQGVRFLGSWATPFASLLEGLLQRWEQVNRGLEGMPGNGPVKPASAMRLFPSVAVENNDVCVCSGDPGFLQMPKAKNPEGHGPSTKQAQPMSEPRSPGTCIREHAQVYRTHA